MCSDNLIQSNIADELRIEGINYKGYGIIPKFVMLDTDLTIEAKGIYAYFCSYAGAGNTAFPGWEKIVSDLGMNKDSYYKHYKMLISNGYIEVYKKSLGGRGVGFQKNIYTLVSNPKKVEVSSIQDTSGSSQKISVLGIKSFGYGFIPKALMTDHRISVKAKSLYAYYCSFSGAGNSACPSRDNITHHLNISKNSFTKYNKELLDMNYIEVVQRHIKGKMGVNDYFIVDKPNNNGLPCTNFSEEQISEIQNRETQKSEEQISEDNINNPINNNITINNHSFNHSLSGKERKNERDIAGDIEKIKELPGYVLDDQESIEKAIYYLCDYDRNSDSSIYEDSPYMSAAFKYDSYMLFVDALIAMLSDPKGKEYNGMTIMRTSIVKRMKRYIVSMADGTVSLYPLIEAAQLQYQKASRKTIPEYPIRFMQHMIINALINGDIETESQIIHDFH